MATGTEYAHLMKNGNYVVSFYDHANDEIGCGPFNFERLHDALMYIGSVDLYTSIDLLGAHVEFHQGEVGVRFVNDKGESVASGVFADIEEARSWAASRGLEVGAWRVE